MATTVKPDRTEAAEYYFTYIDQVPDGVDVCDVIEAQLPETLSLLQSISDEQSLHRYAPDKWTIREVVGHLIDTERLFVFRALWFARALDSALPSFDQNIAMSHAGSNDRDWAGLIDEFRALRESSLAFFQTLPADAWSRRGTASGYPFSVRALAYMTAGHVTHHVKILRDRYLV